LKIIIEIGVPVVFPSNTPDKISILSPSFLGVAKGDWPGFLLSKSCWISDSESSSPAGQPSTTTPRALPCDSPQVEILNKSPNIEPDLYIIFLCYF